MGWLMNEEKALKLFAACYNARDFSKLLSRLHRKATYTAYNRFYVSSLKEGVSRLLMEKAEELRAVEPPNRAYHGFVETPRSLTGTRVDPCLVLTRHLPWQELGIVRIKCTLLHIKDIRILDPATHAHTRADLAGKEG